MARRGDEEARRGIRYLHPRNVETHFISLPLSGVGRPTARRGAAGDEGPHIVTSHGRVTKRAAGRSSSFWYKTAVEGEGSLRLFQHLWGSNERWSLGCVNSEGVRRWKSRNLDPTFWPIPTLQRCFLRLFLLSRTTCVKTPLLHNNKGLSSRADAAGVMTCIGK